jgi:hypothetical protein
MALLNLILAICFIFFIDEININNAMYQYFLLYLLTLLLALCFYKIAEDYDFKRKYPTLSRVNRK